MSTDHEKKRRSLSSERTETGRDGAQSVSVPPRIPQVYWVYSPGCALRPTPPWPLPTGETSIGREFAEGEGIVLEDRRLSRQHATFIVAPDLALAIRDDGSKNGTSVNRQPLRPHEVKPLRDGDVIRVADSLLVARYAPIMAEGGTIAGLLGRAAEMDALRSDVVRIAPSATTVLIQGESGTGKELVAQGLHQLSGRRGPLIAVNSSTIPESLADSTLFGHTAGAFTGARAQPGLFRAAHGGTLFLDEVGELPLWLQSKLLRVLQEHSILPVGAVKAEPCDVRVVAATHRNLEDMVAGGAFREDLYARLSTLIVRVPPLRERREDILLLLCHALGSNCPPLSTTLAEALVLTRWPLNVRGLLQIAERIRMFGPVESLLMLLQPAEPLAESPTQQLGEIAGLPERQQLVQVLERHRWVQRRAAAELGCSRRQLARFMDHYGLPRSHAGADDP